MIVKCLIEMTQRQPPMAWGVSLGRKINKIRRTTLLVVLVAGSAGVAVLTELVISLLALLVSLPPLFESFKILSFNLFM